MGNIYATNPLPDIATLAMQFTVFPLVFTMIMGRHYGLGWTLPVLTIIYYQELVRFGWNIQNPLQNLIGDDETQGSVIMQFIYPIYLLFYCLVAWCLMNVIRAKELFAFGKILGTFMGSRKNGNPPMVQMAPNGDVTMGDTEYNDTTGSSSYSNGTDTPAPAVSRPSFSHLFVTFGYFLVLAASQIAYDQLFLITGDEWIALTIIIVGPFVGNLLYLGYCWYMPDGSFGETKESLEERRVRDNLSDEEIALSLKKTKQAVIWTIVPIGAFSLIGFTIMGLTRYLSNDVDINWIVGACLLAGYILVLIIIYFVQRSGTNPLKSLTKKNHVIPDGGNFYDTPPTTNTNRRMDSVTSYNKNLNSKNDARLFQ